MMLAPRFDLDALRAVTLKGNLHVPPTYFASNLSRLPYEQAVEPIAATDKDRPLHLYLGVPLCEEHCSFCMYFAGFADSAGEKAATCVRGLVEMIDTIGKLVPRKVAGFYVGGGTPSVLSTGQIVQLLHATNSAFDFESTAQRTFEMAPRSITSNKLDALVAAGIDRGSFGVQSFDEQVLRAVNRTYQAPKRIAALVEDCRSAGIAHLNVDLMVGLNGEGPASLLSSLQCLLDMRCSTVSIYRYRPSRQSEMAERGGTAEYLRICRDKIEQACALAAEHGYRAVGRHDGEHVRLLSDEVPQDLWPERNLYETRYRPQLGNSLLGLGVGSRSFLRSSRFVHCDRPGVGFNLVGRDVAVEDCTAFDQSASAVVNDLFTSFRADLAIITETLGIDVATTLGDEIAYLVEQGVLQFDGATVEVHPRHRADWHYWDKVLYPPEWLARRMDTDSTRLG